MTSSAPLPSSLPYGMRDGPDPADLSSMVLVSSLSSTPGNPRSASSGKWAAETRRPRRPAKRRQGGETDKPSSEAAGATGAGATDLEAARSELLETARNLQVERGSVLFGCGSFCPSFLGRTVRFSLLSSACSLVRIGKFRVLRVASWLGFLGWESCALFLFHRAPLARFPMRRWQ